MCETLYTDYATIIYRVYMPYIVQKTIGFILLSATVGLVCLQALFHIN